jgi:UDP-N-acetyl-D-mannosaminuronate dehydrogenase
MQILAVLLANIHGIVEVHEEGGGLGGGINAIYPFILYSSLSSFP